MCVYGLFLAMFFVKRFMFGNFRLPFAETCNKKPNFGRRREIYDFGIRTFLSFVEMSSGQRKNVARIRLIPRVQNAIAALASESRSDSTQESPCKSAINLFSRNRVKPNDSCAEWKWHEVNVSLSPKRINFVETNFSCQNSISPNVRHVTGDTSMIRTSRWWVINLST